MNELIKDPGDMTLKPKNTSRFISIFTMTIILILIACHDGSLNDTSDQNLSRLCTGPSAHKVSTEVSLDFVNNICHFQSSYPDID